MVGLSFDMRVWGAGILMVVVAGFIVSWAFDLPFLTSILAVGLIILAPVFAILVAVFLPGPPQLKGLAALIILAVSLIFGLRYLGVV
jgi:hypothetical protein